MPLFVVIDTNVIISSLLTQNEDASTVQVMKALYDKKFIPIFNDEILSEYSEVLHRPKFHFPDSAITATINFFLSYGIHVERLSTNEILPDPNDLVFYEVCMAKQSESSLLITGNLKHFPSKPFIVTPNEFMDIISSNLY